MFKRRIGLSLGCSRHDCPSNGCPDIWELESGDFAVIGVEKTKVLLEHLPPTAGCARDERIVVLPRRVLVAAKAQIPDT